MKDTYVVPAERGWAIAGRGSDRTVYKTQREAVSAALESIKAQGRGQLIVHTRSGRVREVVQIGGGTHSRVVKDAARTGRLTRSQVRRAVWNATKGGKSVR